VRLEDVQVGQRVRVLRADLPGVVAEVTDAPCPWPVRVHLDVFGYARYRADELEPEAAVAG
jgi:hypothetical protein